MAQPSTHEALDNPTKKSPLSEYSTLRRELGLLDAIGVGFGAIVGAGIFVVTGVAAGVAGPAFLMGLLVQQVSVTTRHQQFPPVLRGPVELRE